MRRQVEFIDVVANQRPAKRVGVMFDLLEHLPVVGAQQGPRPVRRFERRRVGTHEQPAGVELDARLDGILVGPVAELHRPVEVVHEVARGWDDRIDVGLVLLPREPELARRVEIAAVARQEVVAIAPMLRLGRVEQCWPASENGTRDAEQVDVAGPVVETRAVRRRHQQCHQGLIGAVIVPTPARGVR